MARTRQWHGATTMQKGNDNGKDLPAGFEMKMGAMKKTREVVTYEYDNDDEGNDMGNGNGMCKNLPAEFEMKMDTMKKTSEAASQR